MNKKYIFLLFLFSLIMLLIPSCGKLGSRDGEVTSDDRREMGMNIIDGERNIKSISPKEYREFRLEDLIDEEYDRAVIMGRLGQVESLQEGGYFLTNNDVIGYMDRTGTALVEDVIGVVLNPPNKNITHAYEDMSNFLVEEDVLFILLDGLGYHQYLYAIEGEYLPFLKEQARAEKAMSVYKPVTNAGLAAIITGRYPIENGIHSRNERELKVDSIFKLAEELYKKTLYVEGNIGILKTEIEPILHLDENKDGFTDDEVFKATMEAIKEGYNFIFTHFHGIDDCGHAYGPLSEETMEFIKRIDGYLEEMVSKWKGKVIITADHGMHSTDDGGDHGLFRYEDLMVPYIILEGGGQFE
ncbi:alkaline phosphatase family protein [Tepidimicrobium xylanilyticum]|uniref:Type I phosphodiesterase / nucleotide pyrophosphatase n=1 Tax=Tepidimicrobium xylanilyticum TaxID=1123352 RepID=A0A1H2T7Z1_9FIRM|nr:alkaline phosphatase family protein [Tepidimicrobium xylanilyticum]GMG96005.1 hypothetical protein EN5CB1_08310 [Tepidimicrobium xylanilyticum]SDW40053.1 Type I phosphodiesterase / nucleotide pyrophosphatase [Tepidimicrobium xylanilyticum]